MSTPEPEQPGEAQPASNDADITRGRPFGKGNTEGKGRPAGSRNKASLLLDQLADDDGPAILKAMVEMARGGDTTAASLILSRIWPPRRGHPIHFDLPAVTTAADVTEAVGAILAAVAAGEITPTEGAEVAALVEGQRKALETAELVERIEKLEQLLGNR